MIRKTRDPPKVYKTKDSPLELDTQEYGEVEAFARGRAKCDNTIRGDDAPIVCRGINDDSGGVSDMDISEIPEDSGYPFAAQPVLEELLMKEGSDQQEVSMVDMMLPVHKESAPEGNR